MRELLAEIHHRAWLATALAATLTAVFALLHLALPAALAAMATGGILMWISEEETRGGGGHGARRDGARQRPRARAGGRSGVRLGDPRPGMVEPFSRVAERSLAAAAGPPRRPAASPDRGQKRVRLTVSGPTP
jgi:hypothetical protein